MLSIICVQEMWDTGKSAQSVDTNLRRLSKSKPLLSPALTFCSFRGGTDFLGPFGTAEKSNIYLTHPYQLALLLL